MENTEYNFNEIIGSHLPMHLYIIDSNTYDLIHINDKLLNEFKSRNKNYNDYKGVKCYEYIYNHSEPCKNCKNKELEVAESLEWYYVTEESHTTHLVVSERVKQLDKTLFIQSSKELKVITKLKETTLSNNTTIECAKTLANDEDLDTSINRLLRTICEFKKAECCYILERNYDINKTHLTYMYSSKDTILVDDYDLNYYDFDVKSKWSNTLLNSEYIFLTANDFNIEDNAYYRPFILTKNFENVLIIPLKIDGRIIAYIGLNNFKKDNENLTGFETMKTIAMFITNSLFIKYSQEKLENTVSNLQKEIELNSVMMNCIRTLLDYTDFDMAINKLLHLISDYFNAERVYVFKLEPEKGTMFDWFEYLDNVESNIDTLRAVPFDIVNGLFNVFQDDGVAFIEDVASLSKSEIVYNLLLLGNANSVATTPIYQKSNIVGFLLVINPKMNIQELNLMKTISFFITNHMDKTDEINTLGNMSYTDKLTDLYNRNFYLEYINQIKIAERNDIGIIFADVNGLKKANDNIGHEYGDNLIKCCAKILDDTVRGFTFRIGGDEFIIICENTTKEVFDNNVKALFEKLEECGEVHISIGTSWSAQLVNDDIDTQIKIADENMYINKEQYYKNKENDTRSFNEQLDDLRKSIDYLIDSMFSSD